MYTCHICGLSTKQLNGLLTKHWKKHCSDVYSKEEYKKDLLAFNGRQLNICKVCGKVVPIPKGESQSPTMHKQCYLDNLKADNNPNFKGGKNSFTCAHCGKTIEKWSSQVITKIAFCSPSCTMNFYAKEENRTEAQKESDRQGAELFHSMMTDEMKIIRVHKMKSFYDSKVSKLETKMLNKLTNMGYTVQSQVQVGYYVADIFIEELNIYLDVHGNYWHNTFKSRRRWEIKQKYFSNQGLQLSCIWDHEVDLLRDIPDFLSAPVYAAWVDGGISSSQLSAVVTTLVKLNLRLDLVLDNNLLQDKAWRHFAAKHITLIYQSPV